jgi:hypothetical protein
MTGLVRVFKRLLSPEFGELLKMILESLHLFFDSISTIVLSMDVMDLYF